MGFIKKNISFMKKSILLKLNLLRLLQRLRWNRSYR